MKSFKVAILLMALIPTLALAQKKAKKPSVPEVFEHAHFVYVQAVDGNEFDPNLDPADRVAIADVRDAIKAWGRYTMTVDREKADLVFIVRKGRPAEGRGGVGVGNMEDPQAGPMGTQVPGQRHGLGPGVSVGGEAGPEDDQLQVCQLNAAGKLGGTLWIRSFASGLDAPRLLLFAQLKDAVEKAYPSVPPSSSAKP